VTEYYSEENGYEHFLLEADGKTPKKVSVDEWRGKGSNHRWRAVINGFVISTCFFGMKSPNCHPVYWNTSVSPENVPSHHAVIFETTWDTYGEAEAGHLKVVNLVLQYAGPWTRGYNSGLAEHLYEKNISGV
jgi:hypothetical protein